jgi:hypothetical protein
MKIELLKFNKFFQIMNLKKLYQESSPKSQKGENNKINKKKFAFCLARHHSS